MRGAPLQSLHGRLTLALLPGEDEMSESEKLEGSQESRREFVKKLVYVPPIVLTLQAAPAYAKYGSEKLPLLPKDDHWHEYKYANDKTPKGEDKKNDNTKNDHKKESKG